MRYHANNFTIETPDDWQDRSIITFVEPNAVDEFSPNVVITKENVDLDVGVEDYAHRQFEITNKEVVGMKILEQKNSTLNGRPAVEIIQRLTAHGLNLQQLQTFVLLGTSMCVITCTATAGGFSLYLPRFRKILDSFQVR